MDREAIKALISQAYKARDNGELEATMALFHADASFQLAGSQVHAKAAVIVRGHREIRQTLTGLIKTFQFVERAIVSTLIDGDRAAVHSRVKLRFIPTNSTVTTELLDLWRFKDGKAIELVEFADTALINSWMQ